jgi:hypothetical protein
MTDPRYPLDLDEAREKGVAFAEAFATTYPGIPAEGNFFEARLAECTAELELSRLAEDEINAFQQQAREVAEQLYASHVRCGRLESLLDLVIELGADLTFLKPTEEQATHVPLWAESRGYSYQNLEHHWPDGKVINVLRVCIAHRTPVSLHLPERKAWPENLLAAIGEPKVDEVAS